MISTEKEAALRKRMKHLGVEESDLEERFIRGSGHGGQKINKTSSCVQILHRPSGIEVRCQQSRSQTVNRHLARQELCDQLEKRRSQLQLSKRRTRAIRRKLAKRPGPGERARLLRSKKNRSEKKRLRRRPGPGD